MRPLPFRGLLAGLGCLARLTAPLAAQGGAVVGQVTLIDRPDHPAEDVAQTVIWLTGADVPAGATVSVDMATEGKQFVPRLVVLSAGSTISFPNHDPFSHNVFSLSPEAPFDLGLYGRGQAKTVTFAKPGVVRVYCNVHAQMRGLVVVLESALHTQAAGDGSFRFDNIAPGDYVVHAWHERGGAEVTQPLKVTAKPTPAVTVTIDARGYRFVQHRDKNGQSYSDRSRRY
jgi:plastocyanin